MDETETEKFPSDYQEKAVIRLPDGWRDEVKRIAKSRNRSANGEYVEMVRRYIAEAEHSEPKLHRIEDLLKRIAVKLGVKDV